MGLRQENGQARHHPLESAGQGMDGDLNLRILPKKDMVLKINPHVFQFHLKDRNQLAFNVISHPAEVFILNGGF